MAPASLKASAQWTRSEVEAVVARLMDEQFAIKEFRWDHEFVADLGIGQ